MAPAVAVLSVEAADLFATLSKACFEPPWNAVDMASYLRLPLSRGLLAHAGAEREPAGYALLTLAGEVGDLVALGVVPAWRRRGIARALVERCATLALESGARSLTLEVAADNTPAVALYRASGFVEINRRRCYYRRAAAGTVRTMDALVLERRL